MQHFDLVVVLNSKVFNQDWRSNDFPPNATFGKTGSQELGATDGRDYN